VILCLVSVCVSSLNVEQTLQLLEMYICWCSLQSSTMYNSEITITCEINLYINLNPGVSLTHAEVLFITLDDANRVTR